MADLLYCGSEDIDFSASNNISHDVTSTHLRLSWVRSGIICGINGFAYAPLAEPTTECWVSCNLYTSSSQFRSLPFISLVSGTPGNSSPRIGIAPMTTSLIVRLFKHDGTTLTTLSDNSVWPLLNAVIYKIDIYVKYAVDGIIKLYVNGTLNNQFVGDTTIPGVDNLNAIQLENFTSAGAGPGTVSELIVHRNDTRTMGLRSLNPTGDGDVTGQWTGTYTNIDELDISYNDIIYTTAGDNDMSISLTDMPTGTYTINGVKVVARAATGAAGPQNIQAGVRIGGTSYFGPSQPVDTGPTYVAQYFDKNPASPTDNFTTTDVANLMAMLRSKA